MKEKKRKEKQNKTKQNITKQNKTKLATKGVILYFTILISTI